MAIAEQAGSGLTSEPLPRDNDVEGAASSSQFHESAEFDGLVSILTTAGPCRSRRGGSRRIHVVRALLCREGRLRIRSALVRKSGTSIFENCRVGGEVENSILMSFTNKAHSGYVGDSIVGEWVNRPRKHLSNLKNTYGSVRVENGFPHRHDKVRSGSRRHGKGLDRRVASRERPSGSAAMSPGSRGPQRPEFHVLRGR